MKKELIHYLKKLPICLLLGIGVDIVIDGLLLGIGFSAGMATGTLLAIALSLEFLPLGMAAATELNANKIARTKSIVIIAGLALLFFCTAMLGGILLQNLAASTLEIVLSFGVSALLYLVTEELLMEAHEETETIWDTSAFFIGFLIFLILGMKL